MRYRDLAAAPRVLVFDELGDDRAIFGIQRRERDAVMEFLLVALEEAEDDASSGHDAAVGGGEAELEVDVRSWRQVVRSDQPHAARTEVENRPIMSSRFAFERELDRKRYLYPNELAPM